MPQILQLTKKYSLSVDDVPQLIEFLRSRIRELVEPVERGYIRRGQFQRTLCQHIGVAWNPKWTPYINAAMTLEGYPQVIVDAKKLYKKVQYKTK